MSIAKLRSGKDVHIPFQEETQVEEEPQHSTFQPTSVNNQATTSAENNYPTHIREDSTTPTSSTQSLAKEKQPV